MRIKTIWLKLFIQFGVVLVLFGVLVSLSQQLFLSGVQIKRAKVALKNSYEDICMQFEQAHIKGFIPFGEEARKITDQAAAKHNIQIFIFRHSDFAYGEKEMFEISNAKTQGSDESGIFYRKYDEKTNSSYLAYERKIILQGRDTGFKIEVRSRINAIEDGVYVTNVFTQVVSIAAIFLSLVWAFLFSRIFTKPIVNINKITKELASLNFDSKLEIDRSDELGQLAVNINSMSDKLKDALDQLRIKNQQLMVELERAKELDNMRKKFVSDVSHELKTPLAIIQGYAEALKLSANQSPQKREEYCDIIMDETDKMNRLVHGLLNLSQYTSGTFTIDKKPIFINELAQSIAERFATIASQQDVTVETDCERKELEADELRIEQVLSNFMNNALSHVDENRQIILQGREIEGEWYRISVFNSGNHIAQEDIYKLWTPFYKVDKARSRSQGRYGIGLSIVKAIADLHGGRVGVNNVPMGVEFYIDLPLENKVKTD